jgi:hypothetical protein
MPGAGGRVFSTQRKLSRTATIGKPWSRIQARGSRSGPRHPAPASGPRPLTSDPRLLLVRIHHRQRDNVADKQILRDRKLGKRIGHDTRIQMQ